jgi:hypothetical protein
MRASNNRNRGNRAFESILRGWPLKIVLQRIHTGEETARASRDALQLVMAHFIC